ncbi:hypothetical protein D9613_006011 [Agrocybe pediades]|uniref:Septation initiation network scaffold protein cdc11 n=1 Tax=Agrocybe pediades TaxID=84607 RepID=A0A8H4QVG0_9AGAR|nr:hypothetical protein D9613_006011 [Agrocybe pediades]
MSSTVPGWQTEELLEEWPEEEEEENNQSYGSQSVSLTAPLNTQIQTTGDFEPDATPSGTNGYAVGTFLVREDVEHAPIMPKTPGRNKKGMVKDFFTPLPLERMFEPPSPPENQPLSSGSNQSLHSRQSWKSEQSVAAEEEGEEGEDGNDEIVETDVPNMNSFHGRKAGLACQFTFSVPRDVSSRTPGPSNGTFPQAQSTPNPPFVAKTAPPATDPRLRLFQFQYDTYTREHLSALVDSIAVNTPSGTGTGATATPTSFSNGLSRVSEVTGTAATTSHMRSSKRIKLSPSSELYKEDGGLHATIARPKLFGKDYVGESRSLMEKIKQARDYSTISTVASGQQNSPSTHHNASNDQIHEHNSILQKKSPPASSRRPTFLSVPEQNNPLATASSEATNSQPAYSSSSYRQKAAALMDQIKSDVKRQKRVFSGESELSHATTHVEDSTTNSGYKPGFQDGKENNRHSISSTHRRTSSSSKTKNSTHDTSRSRASPRRHAKRLSREEKDLERNLSRLSIQEQQPIINIITHISSPTTVTPTAPAPPQSESNSPSDPPPSALTPNYPSIRIPTNEDLNRFVSSSTASGTTLTAGSAPSFVKHAGPAHIRTIAPTDLPSLPDQFGDMMFDKVMMRWVKNTAKATMRRRSSLGHNKSNSLASELSDDPFGDIESLRDDTKTDQGDVEQAEDRASSPMDLVDSPIQGSSSLHHAALINEMSRISEHTEEVEDPEELELSNFSTDASAHVVEFMTGVDSDQGTGPDGVANYGDETTDSEDEHDTARQPHRQEVIHEIDFDSEFDESRNNISMMDPPSAASSPGKHLRRNPQVQQQVQTGTTNNGQFLTVQTVVTTYSTPSRPANSGTVQSTPIIKSALKSNANTPNSALKNASGSRRYETPNQKKTPHPRSVSFSDGKRDGPIQGITASGGTVQSLRSKRIADMMNALEEDSDLEEAGDDDSPSKVSSSGRPDELQPLGTRQAPSTSANASKAASPRRVFSRTHGQRNISPGRLPSQQQQQTSRRQPEEEEEKSFTKSFAKANATFLTECSFGVAHDRLVEVITDAQPFEPHWEELGEVDLNGKKLESVARLKEFLPKLDVLNLNDNELAWLSGIPGSVRTLSVARNRLTGLTSYGQLLNLENLDISNNEVESLKQLECLKHLRELRADHNQIASLDGLERMDGLVKLSVQGNVIESVDFTQYRWLDTIGDAEHQFESIAYYAGTIIIAIADSVKLGHELFERNSGGGRKYESTADSARRMANLRTLYADNNGLGGVTNVDRLTRLENLSVRNQSGRGFRLLTRDVRDVKRLYLSGNPLESDFLVEPCYNLVYLEVAGCRLSGLPEGMARLLPNLRVLNLNYNFLEDVRGLEGLTRLQKLTVIGSRLKHTKPLIRLVQKMPELEMLDFRWDEPMHTGMVPASAAERERRMARAGQQIPTGSAGWNIYGTTGVPRTDYGKMQTAGRAGRSGNYGEGAGQGERFA